MYSKVQFQWAHLHEITFHFENPSRQPRNIYTVYRLEQFIRNEKPKRWTNIHKNSIVLIFKWHKAIWYSDLIYLFRFDFGYRGFFMHRADLAFSAYKKGGVMSLTAMIFWSMSSNVCCTVNIYSENLREFILDSMTDKDYGFDIHMQMNPLFRKWQRFLCLFCPLFYYPGS